MTEQIPATDHVSGLSSSQVSEMVSRGLVNTLPKAPTRTFGEIVRANVLTPVNGIIGSLLVLILIAGKPGDALFSGVIVTNSIIGILQEVRAKSTLDRLRVLSAPRATVVRDGEESDIDIEAVVLGDLLVAGPGDQIIVDGRVVTAQGLEIDESLLTGESDPVRKNPGDEVLSGSFVSAGSGRYVAVRVGDRSYASTLANEARRFVLVNSELRDGINLILKVLTWIIPPVSALLLWSLLRSQEKWQDALQGTVAAAVAMVPDGLVLLTSIAFIVGVLALARHNALAKELATVELLARVDILCLDKTGTITTGTIGYGDLEILGDHEPTVVGRVLAAMVRADPSPNATLQAVGSAFNDPGDWVPTEVIPFSSARKWAAVDFGERGTWFLGAPEILVPEPGSDLASSLRRHTSEGERVVLLARADHPVVNEELPSGIQPVALVLLEDEVRPDAREILTFLVDQGIRLRVISGDNPTTVAAVARRAGVPGADVGYDARDLPDDPEELGRVLEEHVVFGRVTPHQKRAMVKALQAQGHIVAMTGDGVNDVLALKDADMGIAMGSGSAASKAVAQLTLLDNRFSTLPVALAEGRKVINNIERVANLFVTKTTYAVVLAAATGVLSVPFPFLPRHLTLIGTFSIGVPGFFLAMSPNTNRARAGFVVRVLRYSVPAGIVAGTASFVLFEVLRRTGGTSLEEARTGATVVLLGLGLVILAQLSVPLNTRRTILIVSMLAGYALTLTLPFTKTYFVLVSPDAASWWMIAAALVVGSALLLMVGRRTSPEPMSAGTSAILGRMIEELPTQDR